MHSGITGLLNTVYNNSYASVIILDNRTTAMTGHQDNPASGHTILGDPAPQLDLEQLCRALGVKRVVVVNPHDVEATRKVLKEEIAAPEASVIISRAPACSCRKRSNGKNRSTSPISPTAPAARSACRWAARPSAGRR
jgi:indolepyruvate ferredoxin oxidoreductase, alpha subunit